jgi:hypothetical protein
LESRSSALAKFQRLGPVWRKPKPNPWKKQKNLARWANERQGFTEYNPLYTDAIEVVTGEGYPIFLEGSVESDFISIIQE